MHPGLKKPTNGLLAVSLSLALGWSTQALAQEGPGVGNLTYDASEHWTPIAVFNHDNGTPPKKADRKDFGYNVVTLVNGYLMMLFAPDSGLGPGGLLFYDISDPRAPVLKNTVYEQSEYKAFTEKFRESHSLPLMHRAGKDYAAFQTISGIQIWDVTDPLNVVPLKDLAIDGVNAGDYDNVSWQLSWQGRYLFVANSNDGVAVVDTVDPANPAVVHRIPIGDMGGFRVGPLFAMGDFLVVANMDQNGQYALLDVSDPTDPNLLDTANGMPKLYSMTVSGDVVLGAGRAGEMTVHRFTFLGFEDLGKVSIPGDGLYLSVQDDVIHYGLTPSYKYLTYSADPTPSVELVKEIDLDEDFPELGFHSTDHGQTTPFGNLVFIGNDHGSGSPLIVTDTAPDTKPPAVIRTFPADGTLQMPLTSRVTVSFSDTLDPSTIHADTFQVSAIQSDGSRVPVDGMWTYAFSAASFGPAAPFAPDTTYEVALTAGGIQDVMRNGLAEELRFLFSTGDVITEPEDPPVGTGGTTGSGGMGASGGMPGAGGTVGTGAMPGAGGTGAVASGGTSATGGSGAVTGGAASADPTSGERDDNLIGGCACDLASGRPSAVLGLWTGLLLLGAMRLRRVRRRA